MWLPLGWNINPTLQNILLFLDFVFGYSGNISFISLEFLLVLHLQLVILLVFVGFSGPPRPPYWGRSTEQPGTSSSASSSSFSYFHWLHFCVQKPANIFFGLNNFLLPMWYLDCFWALYEAMFYRTLFEGNCVLVCENASLVLLKVCVSV